MNCIVEAILSAIIGGIIGYALGLIHMGLLEQIIDKYWGDR